MGVNISVSYKAKEDSAKKAKVGFWTFFDQSTDEQARKKREEETKPGTPNEKCLIIVTEILSGSNFFYQLATPQAKSQIEDLMRKISVVKFAGMNVYQPKATKTIVAAHFSVDKTWYRAEVINIIAQPGKDTYYVLRYIDYGNTETVKEDAIRELPEEFKLLPPQARRAKLAYVSAPKVNEEFGTESAELFKELSWGKVLLANVQFKTKFREKGSKIDEEVHHVTLGDEETKVFLNAAMVINGFAHVDARKKIPPFGIKKAMYDVLKQEEQNAKADHLHIWQYGELNCDSDDDWNTI